MKKVNLIKLCLVLILPIIFLHFSQQDIFGQDCTSDVEVTDKGWAPGSEVKVWISPTITGVARTAVKKAFSNWTNANKASGNNSNVTFEFVTTQPASTAYPYYNVESQGGLTDPATGLPRRAETTFGAVGSGSRQGETVSATTRIDPLVTSYGAMLEAISHEIGHPAGFGHCDPCAVGDSIMSLADTSSGTSGFNQTYGRPTTPTDDDNDALKCNNYPACGFSIHTCSSWLVDTCQCLTSPLDGNGGGGLGGGFDFPGGGSEEEDCDYCMSNWDVDENCNGDPWKTDYCGGQIDW